MKFKKYKEIECFFGSKKTTCHIDMTQSQEKSLEFAILNIWQNKQKIGHKRIKTLKIKQDCFGSISIYMITDNNKPGTFGYICPDMSYLFIGRKGGYTAYTRKNKKVIKKTGWKALIYC